MLWATSESPVNMHGQGEHERETATWHMHVLNARTPGPTHVREHETFHTHVLNASTKETREQRTKETKETSAA